MIEFVLVAALLLRDPPGDAVGAGGLIPPSAEQYRNVGSFDLLEVQILESSMLALTIEMAALPNPAGLANGFSNAVIDVYVDFAEGGSEALLPGPEMRMPPGTGWEVALRITGDGATAYRSDGDSAVDGPSVSYPVQVQAEDRVIRVETPFERPEVRGVYALTGVYDPFVASGWRPFAETPSPWAFASTDQRRPVIDLLAPDEVAQAEAIRTGVLPLPQNRTAGAMWMLLMAVGVLVAGVGLVLRRMVRPAPAPLAGGAADGVDGAMPPASSEAGDGVAVAPTPDVDPELVPVIELPKFLPALPPPGAAHRGGGASEAEGSARSETASETSAASAARVRTASTSLPSENSEEEAKGEDEAPDSPDKSDRTELSARPEPSRRFQQGETDTRPPIPDPFGRPDSWLDHADDEPEAQTWRGDAPASPDPEPEPANGEQGPKPSHEADASERSDEKT